ncbi:hypothetical protein WME75_10630 [Sorangium sp. So ce1014]|uniref:hypothetical protein n=1 Tax=Sorangium sp. So ce1014 TaxID=3133326 RepID=UPI003F618922
MSYAGFTLERRGSTWIARRKTRTAIFQLAPARSRREIEAAIDRHNARLTWEEFVA